MLGSSCGITPLPCLQRQQTDRNISNLAYCAFQSLNNSLRPIPIINMLSERRKRLGMQIYHLLQGSSCFLNPTHIICMLRLETQSLLIQKNQVFLLSKAARRIEEVLYLCRLVTAFNIYFCRSGQQHSTETLNFLYSSRTSYFPNGLNLHPTPRAVLT